MKRMQAAILFSIALFTPLPAQAHPGHLAGPFHAHRVDTGNQLASHHEATSSMSPQQMMEKHHGKATGPLAESLKAFHEVLHPLVHDAMPNHDIAAVKAKLQDLMAKAEAMAAIELPAAARKLRNKRDKLIKRVHELNAKAKASNKKFEKAFDKVHEAFEDLADATRKKR